MKIRLKDKVKVISGKDKGKIGEVIKVLPLENKVIVQGINMVKKHVKPGVVNKEGGIDPYLESWTERDSDRLQ